MAAADSATGAPEWTYFYVLPDSSSKFWHDVHQQRLDGDANAPGCIAAAIRAALKNPAGLQVEVKAVHVDLFNEAYAFTLRGTSAPQFIARPKTHAAGVWRPENKRFLARIKSSSQLRYPAIITLTVLNVPALRQGLVSGFDFAYYERNKQKNVTAQQASTSPGIQLTLCLPLVFAVQASLAANRAPAPLDLNTLGSAFLDIIMVRVVVDNVLL
jgi:hypothetical protein